MSKKLKEVVIDRSKWVCGDGQKKSRTLGESGMFNNHGRMCCLGHICHAYGV